VDCVATVGSARKGRRGPYAGAARRRASILDAAVKVFAEHGYSGGSLQKIADVVGMSQTSLLHYFPTKSALLLAVLERRDELAHVAPPAGAAGQAFPDSVVRQARVNEGLRGLIELYTVLAGEAVTVGNPGRAYIAARLASLRDEFTEHFEELERAGRLRPGLDARAAATSLIALWDGLQHQWLLAPDAVDVAAHLEAYLAAVVLPAAQEPGRH
jgi:AcrR family transcriptional regulator